MCIFKGFSLYLVQFSVDQVFFNDLFFIVVWVVGQGFKVLQILVWDECLFDVEQVVYSQQYCDDLIVMLVSYGLVISEFIIYIFGQLVVVYFVYDVFCDSFVLVVLYGDLVVCIVWVVEWFKLVVKVLQWLGLDWMGIFFGVFVWLYLFLFLQWLEGFIDVVFEELVWCWLLILDVCDVYGIDFCYEIYFSEDLYDGISFECFYVVVGMYCCCWILFDFSYFVLQQLDYLSFLDIYCDFIGMVYIKDVEFNLSGCQGIYGGYSGWIECVGCFCFFGDGQVDFKGIFFKLVQYDYDGWVMLEWECCLKNQEDGVCEGVVFINVYIIKVIDCIFDDFVGVLVSCVQIYGMLGIY